ncbi:MAG: hypothetical protein IVW53_00390 [Chloroflexi bacterium]|nr:hypothetical protein [Chloroflexota bacterium]
MRLDARLATAGWQQDAVAIVLERLRRVGLDVDPPDPSGPEPDGLRAVDIVAIGWATVDADRAAGGAALEPRPRDPHLGAIALLLVGPSAPEALPVALLEPDTEGRIAATLARHGEGPAALYVRADVDLTAQLESIRRIGGRATTVADGPFGPSALVLDDRPSGPHLILVGRATIAA